MAIKSKVIPSILTEKDQWAPWKSVPDFDQDMNRKPKDKKFPLNIHRGVGAKSNDPRTWASFDDVMTFLDENAGYQHDHINKDGVEISGRVSENPGFYIIPENGLVGVDLDDCRDTETGEATADAQEIITSLNSYTEVSTSGTGYHIILKGTKPPGSRSKVGWKECYNSHYFICTGDALPGHGTIEDRQTELEIFLERHMPSNPKKPLNGKGYTGDAAGVDVQVVMDRMNRSKKAEKIRLLLDGDQCGLLSKSEADQSLCNYIVFFCGHIPYEDVSRIVDEIFRNSKRMRDKWDLIHRSADGATYGQMTIENAISGTIDRYMTRNERVLRDTTDVAALLDQIGRTIDDVIGLAYDGQSGCRELFIDIKKGKCCFDHAAGTWHEFTGHAWRQENLQKVIDECDILKSIYERADAELGNRIVAMGQDMINADGPGDRATVESKIEQAKGQQKVVRGIVRYLNTLSFRKQVVEFAAVGAGSLGIEGEEWDRMPWHLACKNGVLDLKTGMLRDGMPEDYLKSTCPTAFNPYADCPQFCQAVQEIFGNSDEMVEFIQRVLGMALVGVNIEHKLLILWGAGRNGKDTLLKAVKNVLGNSLAGEVRSEMLLDQKYASSSSGPSADIMRLRGLRAAWASETNEGRRMDAGKVKYLTGGGDVSGRPPYGRREISFPQSYSLFLLTNAKPHVAAEDFAMWQRICLVPFNMKFVDDPKEVNEKQIDRYLDDKLATEAEGILAWMVQGCLNWQREGLNPPGEVVGATEAYRAGEDILQLFIDECCIVHKEANCKSSRLYEAYKKWAQAGGMDFDTITQFGKKMSAKFEKKRDSSANRYLGVGIASTGAEDLF